MAPLYHISRTMESLLLEQLVYARRWIDRLQELELQCLPVHERKLILKALPKEAQQISLKISCQLNVKISNIERSSLHFLWCVIQYHL